MDFLRKLLGFKDPDTVAEELSTRLRFQSRDVAACQSAVDRFAKEYPMIAAMGIPMFIDAPPQWLLEKIEERDNLSKRLFKAREKEEEVRLRAARQLGKVATAKAVEDLITGLNDDYVAVRRETAQALGRIADPRAESPLAALAASDPDQSVRDAARQSTEAIRRPSRAA